MEKIFRSTLSLLMVPNPKLIHFPNWIKQTALQQSTAQQLSNEWSYFRVLSIESKVRQFCITLSLNLRMKGLKAKVFSVKLLKDGSSTFVSVEFLEMGHYSTCKQRIETLVRHPWPQH